MLSGPKKEWKRERDKERDCEREREREREDIVAEGRTLSIKKDNYK